MATTHQVLGDLLELLAHGADLLRGALDRDLVVSNLELDVDLRKNGGETK